MGNEIVENILKVSQMTGGVTEVVIFTENFKIYGTLVTDRHELIKHILTLKNATICHHFDECSCNTESPTYEWLNIIDEKITAFTVLGYMSCEN